MEILPQERGLERRSPGRHPGVHSGLTVLIYPMGRIDPAFVPGLL